MVAVCERGWHSGFIDCSLLEIFALVAEIEKARFRQFSCSLQRGIGDYLMPVFLDPMRPFHSSGSSPPGGFDG